jgi:hypothetical protein
MGGTSSDSAYSIAVDGSGNSYITGNSYLDSWGSPIVGHAGKQDVFVLKLNTAGARQWNTFMGSSEHDFGKGIAVDAAGNSYITGYSAGSWGTSPISSYTGSGQYDIMVAELSSSGARQWNTFLGTASSDIGNTIAVNSGGSSIFVAGSSDKDPIVSAWGTPVDAHAGSEDGFVAKLNGSGALQWNTYMGAGGYDGAQGVALDLDGNVYVSGGGEGTWGSPTKPPAGNNDAFAVKLDGTNGARLWNTFHGTPNSDYAHSIAADSEGSAYITGETFFPLGTHDSDATGFAVKLGIDEGCSFFIIPANNGMTAICM